MLFKRFSLLLLPVTIGAILISGAASAHGAPGHAAILIRHQLHGCHAWSVDGGVYKARQSVTLRLGATLSVRNADVMPHRLILASGPTLHIVNATMGKMGASSTMTLTHRGTYRFTTKAGEDYMAGMKTIGDDNVLKLTVVVE